MSAFRTNFPRVLAALYMGLIFWLSSKPSLPVPALFEHQDKVFHLTEYLGLGFLLAASLPGLTLRRRFWIAFSLASVYGISDEVHQSFVPGRECSVADWLADTAGGWLGVWLFQAFRRLAVLKKS